MIFPSIVTPSHNDTVSGKRQLAFGLSHWWTASVRPMLCTRSFWISNAVYKAIGHYISTIKPFTNKHRFPEVGNRHFPISGLSNFIFYFHSFLDFIIQGFKKKPPLLKPCQCVILSDLKETRCLVPLRFNKSYSSSESSVTLWWIFVSDRMLISLSAASTNVLASLASLLFLLILRQSCS
jgi:hypothetical protein